MFYGTRVVIIFISVIQQVLSISGETLATKVNERRNGRNNPTTSYYLANAFGPNTYAFGFQVNDKATGNVQFRDERGYANGTTHGSYGYVRPDGRIMVTNYLADNELGYLSQSRNIEPGEELVWQKNWPTKRPNKSPKYSDDMAQANLTSILLPVESIEKEHGIDLNPPALEKKLINPVVLEAINGEAPLISDPKKSGFETINKFIPSKFPIVPFELPSDDLKVNLNQGFSEIPIPVLNKTNSIKTNMSDSRNSLKLPKRNRFPIKNNTSTALFTQTPKKSLLNSGESNKLPKAESIITNKSTDWYDKIINQARQEYLQIVH